MFIKYFIKKLVIIISYLIIQLTSVHMKLIKIQLEDVAKYIDPFAIKNFIITNETFISPHLLPNCPFVLEGVAFAICISGKAQVKINTKEYQIEKNMVIAIMPYFITELIHKSDDLKVEFLIFSFDFLIEIPSIPNFDITTSIMDASCLKITEDEASKYLELHYFIAKQYQRNDHPYREEMSKSLLHAMFAEIGSIYYNQIKELKDNGFHTPSYNEGITDQFFKLLLQYHKQERSVQFYADKMCISAKYLSTIMKEKTGRTALIWINETMISSIKYHLKSTDMTIVQISERLNFPSPSFLGRFFKKHVGTTPLQYREN